MKYGLDKLEIFDAKSFDIFLHKNFKLNECHFKFEKNLKNLKT